MQGQFSTSLKLLQIFRFLKLGCQGYQSFFIAFLEILCHCQLLVQELEGVCGPSIFTVAVFRLRFQHGVQFRVFHQALDSGCVQIFNAFHEVLSAAMGEESGLFIQFHACL